MAGSKPVFSDATMALLDLVRQDVPAKQAFVAGPAGDPAAAGGGGGAPPPGGAPAGDPAAAAGGGPPPGMAMPGGGQDLGMMIQQAVQQAMMSQGGGAGGAGGLKPKIDVNVEIMQIKNMLAMIIDKLGIHMPAQDMSATPEKLTAMAQGQNPAVGAAGIGGGGGMPPGGAAMPPDAAAGGGAPPKTAEAPRPTGRAYGSSASLGRTAGMASALSSLWSRK